MILNLINYSLNQKLLDFSIKKVDRKLVKINQEEKKFIVYVNEIRSSGKGRTNPSEKRIQVSPRIKRLLIENEADDFKPVLLGYHKQTNTFTFWKFDIYIETNTMQSFYTRSQTLQKAQKEGFDIYFYQRRDAFNRGIDERNQAFSANAFLLPLVFENYNKIFNREISEIFGKKIKNFNKPFTKDELIMTLNLYSKYPLGSINKNDPELSEITSFCGKRAKLLGFNPINQFYPRSIANKFRNASGIYLKIQNFKVNDPNYKKKGMTGGSQSTQQKVWDLYSDRNNLNKDKLLSDSKEIKKKILSERIDVLIGETEIEDVRSETTKSHTEDQPNILLEFDLDQSHSKSTINLDNFSDPIEACNARDRATRLHEEVLKKLARMCKRKNLPIKKSVHIDFYTEYQNRGKLFEIKTFNNYNFKQQIRHGIIQLKEYYFIYAKYSEEILKQTDLFLLLNDNPEKIIEAKQIRFLKDQNIRLCWPQNNKIVTFKKDKWSDTHPAIKWLL